MLSISPPFSSVKRDLKLLDCSEEEFLKFINVVISPEVRVDENEIEKYISVIESLLPKEYEIIETGDKNGKLSHSVLMTKNIMVKKNNIQSE